MTSPPPRRTVSLRALAGALGLLLTTACANGQPPPDASGSIAKMKVLIGSAACESDAQCRTVPIGAKACGGPEGWLPWSVAATDGAALQAEAGRQAGAARTEAGTKGMASTCSVVADPGAVCAPVLATAAGGSSAAARVCRLRAVGVAGPAAIR